MIADPVTLQISLAPSDLRHAEILLPHQIRAWRSQISEILITVDFHRSAGRFSAQWESGREKILTLASSIEGARILAVDYEEPAMLHVAKTFFGSPRSLPAKDFRGGPFYSYFFALHAAQNDYVFHMDSDLFFGGGSHTWVKEAIELMRAKPEIFVTAPLPGPPNPSGRLRQLSAVRRPGNSLAYDFTDMSTRLFLVDRRRFEGDFGPLKVTHPSGRSCLKAWIEGNPTANLPEHLISSRMRERGLLRHDFLGSPPGTWSLHPPYRCADFYGKLPELVRRVEAGDMPEAQLGDHDINDSLVDWSEARNQLQQNRWWRRILKSNRWTRK